MTDYREAIQSPHLAFLHPDLRAGRVAKDQLGLPKPITGGFASVYELETPTGRWAVRCFLREFSDQERRYNLIASHLQNHRLPYLVQFEYLPSGIRVQGSLFPILKMQWIEGKPLNKYIEQQLTNSSALETLEKQWFQLLAELKRARIAHGDLQHGNILVLSTGELRLIDYDGMWVPALDGTRSHEVGHPAYQNPKRTEQDFHERIDEFAGTVIAVAIRAVQRDPTLWDRFNNDDNILFTRHDFLDTSQSALFATLLGLRDTELTSMATQLIRECGGGNPVAIATVRSRVVQGAHRDKWIGDFVPGYSPASIPGGARISFEFAFTQVWRRPGERRVAKVRSVPIYVTKTRQVPKQETVTNEPLAWFLYIALQVIVAALNAKLLVLSVFLGLGVFALARTTQNTVVEETYQEQSGTRDVTEFVYEHLPGHRGPVSRVALSQDGACVFSSDVCGTIAGWNTADGAERNRICAFRRAITGLRALNGHNGLVAACAGQTIELQTLDGQVVRVFVNERSNFYNIALSKDSRFLAGAIGGFKILLWDLANGQRIRTFGSHRKKVLAVAFSPDGNFLASGSADMTAKIWLLQREQCVYTLNGHTAEVNAVAFSPNGELLASGGNDGCVFLWDVKKGRQLMRLTARGSNVHDVLFAPTSTHVIAACSDGQIRCWDVKSGRQLRSLLGHSGAVVSLDMSADGRQLVSGGTDGIIYWTRSS